MRVSKSEIKYTRTKGLVIAILLACAGIVSYHSFEKAENIENIPQFTPSTPEASVIFKGHFLSVLRGASPVSGFSNFKEKFQNSVLNALDNRNSNAQHLAFSLLKLMNLYENRQKVGERNFWSHFSHLFGLGQGEDLFKLGTGNLKGKQLKFWKAAKKSYAAGEEKDWLFSANDGNIAHFSDKDEASMRVVLSFEKERLRSELTQEDNLFLRVLEKKVILGEHKGIMDLIDKLRSWFNVRNDFNKDEEKKDEEKKGDEAKTDDEKKTTDSKTDTSTHNTAKLNGFWMKKAASVWKVNNRLSKFAHKAHDSDIFPRRKEFDESIAEKKSEEETLDDGGTEEKEVKSRSEIAKEEQAKREKERDERMKKREATRVVWEAKEQELRKKEEEELSKHDKGSAEYKELVLKFKQDRKQRRIDLFNKLWSPEEVVAHPGYQ